MKKVLLFLSCVLASIGGRATISSGEFGTGDVKSTWSYDSETKVAVVTINNNHDVSSMENEWIYGTDVPFKAATKLVLNVGEGVTIDNTKNEYYMLCQNTSVSTFDLSSLTGDNATAFAEILENWGNVSDNIDNVIVPNETEVGTYCTKSLNYFKANDGVLNAVLNKKLNDIIWNDVACSCTTLNVVSMKPESSAEVVLSNAPFTTIYLTNADVANVTKITVPENAKVVVPSGYSDLYSIEGTDAENIEEVTSGGGDDPTPGGDDTKCYVITDYNIKDWGTGTEVDTDNKCAEITLSGNKTLEEILEEAKKEEPTLTMVRIAGELTEDDIAYLKKIDIKHLVLTDCTFADGMSVDDLDFSGNTNIEDIVLPANVTDLNSDTFSGCTNLNAAVSLSDDKTSLTAYINKAGHLSTTLWYTSFRTSEYSCSPASVTTLKLYGNANGADISNGSAETIDGTTYGPALTGANLVSLDLSNAVFKTYETTKVSFSISGVGDFEENANGLENIKLHKTTLQELKLPETEGTTLLPGQALNGCDGLTGTFTVPANIKTIGTNALGSLSNITGIEVNGAESLGEMAFANCTALTNIILRGTGLKTIPSFLFSNSQNIAHFVIPEGVETIDDDAFTQNQISSLSLPSTLKKIGDRAFTQCLNLKTITIPENVEEIGHQAFYLIYPTDIYVLAKQAPKIYRDTFYHNACYGGGSGYNTGADYLSGNMIINEAYTTGMDSNPMMFLHFPEGSASEYTITARNNTYKLIAAVKDGNGTFTAITETDENGDVSSVKRPNWNDDLAAIHTAHDKTSETVDETTGELTSVIDGDPEDEYEYTNWWQYIALAEGFSTNNDNSNVWTVRHMKKDVWYTMCFPFDITRDQLEATFGYGTEIATFAGTSTEEINGEEYTYLDFTTDAFDWEKTTGIDKITSQGVPYMIHPAIQPLDEKFVISGVNPDYTGGAGSVTVDGCGYTFIGSYGTAIQSGDKFVDMYDEYPAAEKDADGFKTYVPGENGMPDGLLVPKPIEYGWYFLGTKAGETYPKFFRQTSKDMSRTTGLWTRFTAMVKPAATASGAKEIGMALGIFDDSDVVVTRIKDVKGNVIAEEVIGGKALMNNVYSINGKLVRSGSTSLDGLTKGVYVVNGRKYVVK